MEGKCIVLRNSGKGWYEQYYFSNETAAKNWIAREQPFSNGSTFKVEPVGNPVQEITLEQMKETVKTFREAAKTPLPDEDDK
jgi:hypothetical protein